ncbi:low-density lipoprotein receptor class A domain-containing protein 4 isoform X3 [Camelus dromedarius]|uniref:low-density lipoprotein receptor class A domain-containing protein 4 isoform X3 n=1 Tax=Camelus dromedarius TaxID=9838 RepID=UPI001263946A|nr:low-density lipoprotein receptor class A domain-containing protein 4 isoform X2 [Camelus dromedarius]
MQEAGFPATHAFTECKFTCTSGRCLYLGSLVCNQQNDCGDNSDEENCLLVTEHPPPGIFSWLRGPCVEVLHTTELELAQVVVIVVVVMVMVVVIICLLSHYRVSTRSFIHRPSRGRRPGDGLQPEGRLWPLDGSGPLPASEVICTSRSPDALAAPSFLQRGRFSRFQPTYPYVQHEIDLPPTISLSDGEEPPPYQGPCTLQLRDAEQQLELNRESVRAPPNRTIFDSDLMDASVYGGGPCPPSSHSGISASTCSSNGRMEGPPPAYSEVTGPDPGASLALPPHGSAHSGGMDRKPGNLV